MKSRYLFFIALLFISCDDSDVINNIENMRVNYYTITCEGVGDQTCLLIQEGDKVGTDNWTSFYDTIEGFTYEKGFVYDLEISKETIENPPADGSSIKYKLSKIKSKSTPIIDAPQCVKDIITSIKNVDVTNPPSKVYSYQYHNETVYYIPPVCCDIYSKLYDSDCNLLCAPDGGIIGNGDGQCSDFFTSNTNKKLIWIDIRS